MWGSVGRGKPRTRRNDKARPSRSSRTRQRDGTTFSNGIVQATLVAAIAILVGAAAWLSVPASQKFDAIESKLSGTSHRPTSLQLDFAIEPTTLDELLGLPVERLAEVDIARVNLLCASAMPSTSNLDIEHCLAVLDQWAARIAAETDRHLYRLTDPRFAGRWNGSEAHFRAEMLAQVLQEDLGVTYDLTAEGDFSFADPKFAFIHGMIPGPNGEAAPGGTCVSMPVLYVAVGRRLGYPLKLALTDSHIFARWDGLDHPNPAWRERFNCETTNGFQKYEDDYYRSWPIPVTEAQVRVNGLLLSLDASEEFAQFLAARGHHGFDHGEFGFAARCYENAHRYDTRRPAFAAWFIDAAMRCDYQPVTPHLASKLQRRRYQLAALADRPNLGHPLPSQTAQTMDPAFRRPTIDQPWRREVVPTNQPSQQPKPPNLFRSRP